MARETPIPLPEDEYVLLIGQVAYMVGYLEWTILGDLERLAPDIPPELSVNKLAGESTGSIAKELKRAVGKIHKQDVKVYIERGAEVLSDAAKRRNHLLHARAATVEGHQRLHRWKTKDRRGPHVAFSIEIDWLNETIDALSTLTSSLNHVRPRDLQAAEE